MRGKLVGAATILFLIESTAALATCEGRVVLFEDRFDRLEPTWGEADEAFKAEDGILVVAPEPATYLWRTNQASLYDDVDMCATLATIDAADPEDTIAGLVFWYVDENNFYVFEYAPNGKASVWRRQRGQWLEQVPWEEVDGVAEGQTGSEGESAEGETAESETAESETAAEGETSGEGETAGEGDNAAEDSADQTNDLRVVTRGDRATLYFNGEEFAEFDGVPPNDGQRVGVLVASPESGTARFAFDEFRVTRP